MTNAPPDSTCTITITARGSATVAVPTSVQNTATLAGTAPGYDLDSTDNNATVTTTINPAALLTITKTNSISTVTAGQTMSYTVTVANLGPSPANNSVVQDPATPGLTCTGATCAVTGGAAACPATTITGLQSPGITITSFPANSSLTFKVTCGVSATGF